MKIPFAALAVAQFFLGQIGDPTLRVAAYTRTERGEPAFLAEGQLATITAWAAKHNALVMGTYSDLDDARGPGARRGFVQAMDLVAAGRADAVVVTRLDRISRNLREVSYLVAEGVQVIATDEALDTRIPKDRIVLRMLAEGGR